MKSPINPVTTTAFLLFHVGAIAAMFFFNWHLFLLAVSVWYIAGSLGIGIGFHRLLTHRGFETPKWLEYLLTICGCLSLQGGPIWWVTWHRIHHKYTEQQGMDPHTPRDGKFWSHMGWLIYKVPRLHKPELLYKYSPDLCQDNVHRLINRLSWLPIIIWGSYLLFVFGFATMLWGAVVPVVFLWHATWFVNSATHLWGKQPFKTATTGDSRNNWWVALLTFGEGWHNNHHARPFSARHGLMWYQLDFNWYGIIVLKWCKLIKNVQV